MTKAPTLQAVVDELKAQNLLPPLAKSQIVDTLTVFAEKPPTPWFVSALIGISAWISVIPFLGFLFISKIVASPESAIVVGAVFVIGSISLLYLKRNSLFLGQLALALNLTGQVLFIGGIFAERNVATAAMATWFLEIVLIASFRDSILRFLAVLIATGAALVLLHEFDIYQASHVLIILIAASAIWYWIAEASHLTDDMMVTLYQPLGYGFVIALQMLLILSILPDYKPAPHLEWEYSTLGLTVLLLALEYHLLHTNKIPIFSAPSLIIFTSTVLVAALLYQAPGIIASIIVILLGFQRGNRVLMGLALIFLTVFFIAYYYYLDISLLMKSVTLTSSGLTLLALRFVLKRVFPLLEERRS